MKMEDDGRVKIQLHVVRSKFFVVLNFLKATSKESHVRHSWGSNQKLVVLSC